MPGGNDGAVVLVVKCSAAKIHHPHCCTLYSTLVSLLLHIVCDCEVRVDKENVLWFQICVGQFVFMQKFDSQADLVGHMAHLADGVGQVIVFFEEIKSTESQELKTDTHMAMIVEPVKHLHTQILILRILFIDSFQDVDLQPGSLFVLFHIFDDFQSDMCSNPAMINTLHHPPEGALAQSADNLISLLQDVATPTDQVTLLVVPHTQRPCPAVTPRGGWAIGPGSTPPSFVLTPAAFPPVRVLVVPIATPSVVVAGRGVAGVVVARRPVFPVTIPVPFPAVVQATMALAVVSVVWPAV